MKKRILFILHLPPPVHGAAAVGKYIQDSKLINENFDCTYINLSTANNLKDIGKSGFKKLFIFLKLYWKVFVSVARHRYDLCYLTINSGGSAFYKDIVTVFILKIFGRKVVYHYHNKGISRYQNKSINNLLYRFQFKNSSAILLTPLLYNDVAKYLHRDQVYFCPNGIPEIKNINLASLNTIRASNSVPELLFLSNMIKEKGVFTILDAGKILHEKGIQFKINFIGDWFDISAKEFESYVAYCGLEKNVEYLGKKYGAEKYSYFEKADMFIFPTFYHNEAFPLVLLEAMQFGLPVISTNEGGIPDIVTENETGYIIERENPQALAMKIQYLIENGEKRINMGTASKIKFERLFCLNVFEKNLNSILETLTNKRTIKTAL
ncbi:MAG: glycosyltransferase family 4 protein [Chitinophagaceae bacterium]